VFAFGVLGLVALLAGSVRASNEARFRSEAAYIANGMISDMWTMDASTMTTQFGGGGAKLVAWTSKASSLLPASTVAVAMTPGLSSQSSTVDVKITWKLPGSTETHNYIMTAQIGKNL
jgi:type IV pilus assembly protein PilV